MKRFAAAVCLFAPLAAPLAAQAPQPAFVDVVPAATSAWMHQPLDVVVRLGIDSAFFTTQAVPLFQQQLDQPFQVNVPWLFSAEDRAVEFVPPPAGTLGQRIAVGDTVVVAAHAPAEKRGDRSFDVLELRYRWTPLSPGTSAIAPVELRYAFATRFEEDFLRGRQPVDRQEASIVSAPSSLAVKALPAAGRPGNWTGAVGEFTVAATAAVTAVGVGTPFPLEVTIGGDGNLDRFAPLPLPQLAGFHVQGVVERRSAGTRTFVFDVLPLREGETEVLAIPFAAFSPVRGEYVTHVAGPVRIVVGPATGPVEPRVQELIDANAHDRRTRTVRTWGLLALAVVLLVAGLRRSRNRRRRRRATMRAAFDDVAAATDPADVQRTFEALCARAAGHDRFHGAATWRTLRDTEAPEPVVADAERLHAALDAARFGGAPVPRDELLRTATAVRDHGELVAT